MNELIDTSHRVLRIRSQMKDLGSYEVSDIVKVMKKDIDSILNPEKKQIEKFFKKYKKSNKEAFVVVHNLMRWISWIAIVIVY